MAGTVVPVGAAVTETVGICVADGPGAGVVVADGEGAGVVLAEGLGVSEGTGIWVGARGLGEAVVGVGSCEDGGGEAQAKETAARHALAANAVPSCLMPARIRIR